MIKSKKKYMIILILFILTVFNKVYAIKPGGTAVPGEIVYLPDPKKYTQMEYGNLENELDKINWHWSCKTLYDDWVSRGKPTNDKHLAYITTAGVDWIFVAVSETFGYTGDYIKVHSKSHLTGKEFDTYMLIFDVKSKYNKNAYFVNGIHYGHKQHRPSDGKAVLDVLEFPWHGAKADLEWRKNVMPVIWIQNGGSYLKHPEGPTGFSVTTNVDYEDDSESSTIIGAIGQFFRNGWNSLTTFLDNHLEKKNKSTVLFDLSDGFGNGLVWPVPGYTKVGSPFTDARKDPLGSGKVAAHTGIDIGAPAGTIEVAAGTGKLETAGYFTKGSGYQSYLYLDDKDSFGGQVIFGYLHTAPEPIEKAGTHVYAGQPIAKVGPKFVTINGQSVRNGSTTGPHLHFSMRIKIDGVEHHVDPEIYFPEEMRK